MRNQQIPSAYVMSFTVHCYDLPPLDCFQGIAEYMPLRVTAGRFLNVAAVRFVAALAERFADGLRFLAGN